jgi:transglutaminase-like putative cysteine protease
MASRAARIAGRVGLVVLRVVWVSTMVLTPLFGFWLASSLAAYHNASQWLSLLVGLLLFPILPVGWDLVFVWRMRAQPDRRRFLTRLDRLVLRTLLVNGVFLAVLLGAWPASAFRALAVRGDWILDGHHGPVAEAVRGALLGLADRLDDDEVGRGGYGTSDAAPDPGQIRRQTPPPVDPTGGPYRDPSGWPFEAVIHPVVSAMPADVQSSPESVGRYLAAQIPAERDRIKAVHDYVIERLVYDHATADLPDHSTNRPSQLAPDVFAARTAVCEGYARLSVAIGEAAGLQVAYITGPVRAPLSELRGMDVDDPWSGAVSALAGYYHAWNAVRLDGWWYLFDATWDDEGKGQDYETTYFLTPPHLFALDHLPDEPTWQLLPEPMTHNEFLRQPALRARIGTLGVTLRDPARSQVTVDGSIDVVLDNPHGAALAVDVKRAGTTARVDCEELAPDTRFRCAGLGDGEYEVLIFGGHDGARSLGHVGSIWVNSH